MSRPGHLVKVVNHDGTTHSVTRNGGGFSVIVPAHSGHGRRLQVPLQVPRHDAREAQGAVTAALRQE
jgi:hypothetical protein